MSATAALQKSSAINEAVLQRAAPAKCTPSRDREAA